MYTMKNLSVDNRPSLQDSIPDFQHLPWEEDNYTANFKTFLCCEIPTFITIVYNTLMEPYLGQIQSS
jgi:hypothetical protein